MATSTQAHCTLQTLAGTATEQRTEQTASGTHRLQSHDSLTEAPRSLTKAQGQVVRQWLITGGE